MKKQNLIIIGVFILVVIGFYLISCNEDSDDVSNSISYTPNDTYVKVSVGGEVLREGSYSVPSYWTLEMLFNYTGVKDTADLSGFDLTLLVEEGNYYIPKRNVKLNKLKININSASKEELMSLNGIGESISECIILYRKNSLFTSVEELKNIKGIGDKVYEKIKDYVTV